MRTEKTLHPLGLSRRAEQRTKTVGSSTDDGNGLGERVWNGVRAMDPKINMRIE